MKKILYLDDSRAALLLLTRLLKDFVEVLPASTIDEAERMMSEKNIELFLVDYTLGEKNGIDFSRDVRKHTEYSKTPIIMVTASYSEQLAYQAMHVGINECFPKPIEKNSFKQVITKQLDKPYTVEVVPTTLSMKCYAWEKSGFFYQYAPQIEQLVRDTSSEGVSKKMQELLRIKLKDQLDAFEFIVEKAAVHHTVNIKN